MPGKKMINFMAGLLFVGIFCLSSGALGSLPYDDAGLSSEKGERNTQVISEVVFIDPSVREAEIIVSQLPEGIEVVRLSPIMDGVEQISVHLSKKRDLSAIHIISHGDAGHFVLNGKRIDRDFLLNHGNRVTAWGRALTKNGDILLYACNLAATDEGKAFVERFVDLTDADVAASTDSTGGTVYANGIAYEGNWILEFASGNIGTAGFSVDSSYNHLLRTATWDGEDLSGTWTTPENWDTDVAPVAGTDSIVIPYASGYDPVFTGDLSYIQLTVEPTGILTVSSGTLSVSGTSDINGTLSISTGTFDANGVFDATDGNVTFTGAGNLKLASTVTSLGTFTKSTGTVTYDGGDQTVAAVDYYNLTKNVTSATTLTFPSATRTTVENTLDLRGTSGQLLSLIGDSTAQWEIDPQGTRTIGYLNVRDSNNVNTTAINAVGTNSISSGNNTNWTFTAPTITSFSPTAGGTNTSVIITGTNFTGATAVKFGGTDASDFTVYSLTQITAVVANGSTTGTVTVTTPEGTAASSGSFTYGVVTPGTYYVDIATGNDSSIGTSANPWKTLHYAVDQINGGNTGTYTLNVALGTYSLPTEADTELTLSQSNVTIVGASGSGPIIDGTEAGNWTYGIKITGSYVTLRNLYVTGFTSTDPEATGTGIEIVTGSNNTIENCRVYGNYDGISVWQSDNCTIQDSEIDNNVVDGISITGSAGSIITRNTIHDNFEPGNSDGIIVQNCNPEISRNTIYNNRFNISLQADSGDITSPTIKNNLIYESTLDGVHYGIYIGGNSGSTVSPQIYHNTIDGSLYQGILIEGTGDTPIIKYNIVTNCRQSGIQNSGNPTIDYNDVWHNGPDPYDRNYDGCTAGAHDISQAPQYVGWPYADYTLAVTSPCINAIPTSDPPNDPVTMDFDGENRPYGSGFDMGCYENFNLPAVTTTAVSSITTNTASSGGNVTSSGSESPVGVRGVCWSTSANPTVALPTKTTDGTETGTFTSSITGLTPNTPYHVRAYFINNDNVTGYGSDLTFTTAAAAPTPTLTSFSPTSGGTGTSVTITGTNFTGATAVNFGGTAASSFSINSSTRITAIVGSGSTGEVAVTTPGGTATSTNDFTYTAITVGTYYVNIASGNNSNDGSATHPWKTIHHAVSQINGGSTGTYVLHVALGTHSIANGEADTQMVLSQSRVTIIGEKGSAPIIDGTNAQTWTKGLKITGSNVIIENLHVTGFSDTDEEGIRISGGTGNEIRYCKIYGNNWGIRVNEASGSTIRNCEIFENLTHGIDIVQSTETTVVDNKIHNNPQYGIRTESSPEISRNMIYDNSYGILVEALNESSSSPTIKNNMIYETVSGAMSYGILTRANNYSQTNPVIYHNTIDGGTLSGIAMEDYNSYSFPIIKYNIITNFGQYGIYNSGASPTTNYNDVWNNTAGNYEGCTAGPNDLDPPINPLYVTGSYSLQSDSPCINAIPSGEEDPVTLDFPGYKRPRPGKITKDMGAYEYVADEIVNYTLPGGTGDPTDYRIFTIPLELGTGADMLTAMEAVLGSYDPTHWRGFLYTGTSYREFNSSQFASHTIVPGMGFWIITTYANIIPFEAKPAPDGVDYVMELQPGWHLIGLPWLSTQISLGNMSVTNGVYTYGITSDDNNLTQQHVWDFTGDGPDNGYIQQNASGFLLQHNTGYFFKVVSPTPVRLIIPTSDARGQSAPNIMAPPLNGTNTHEDDELPPPPPGQAPSPDIKANGQDGPVAVTAGNSVSISVTLDPGVWNGRNADWWVAAHTPFDPLNWYTYVYPGGWRSGIQVCVQTPLLKLITPFNVLNMVLPVGDYTFYFAVDGNMDGVPDVTWVDTVEVNVE